MAEKDLYNLESARLEADAMRELIGKDIAKKEDYEKAEINIENYRNGLRSILETAVEYSDGKLRIGEDGVLILNNKRKIGQNIDAYLKTDKTTQILQIRKFHEEILAPLEKAKLLVSYSEAVKELTGFYCKVMPKHSHENIRDWTNLLIETAGADKATKDKAMEDYYNKRIYDYDGE